MNCFLFEGLTDDEKALLFEQLAEPVTVKKGGELYKSGALGILLKGEGTIQRIGDDGHTVTVRTAKDGDVFGSASVFGSWKEGKSRITAASDCTVYYVSETVLKEIMSEFPTVAFNYISFLTDRIRFLNRRLDTFSAENTEHRIYEYLVSVADCDGKACLDFSLSELARRLKIGRTSLYRGFDTLQQRGLIVRTKNTVIITGGENL